MVDMQKARALAKRINDMTGDGTHTIGDVVAALGLALGLTVVPAETEDEAQGAIRDASSVALIAWRTYRAIKDALDAGVPPTDGGQ